MPALTLYIPMETLVRLDSLATQLNRSPTQCAAGLIGAALEKGLEPIQSVGPGRPARNTLSHNPIELALLKGPLTAAELMPHMNGDRPDAWFTDMTLRMMVSKGTLTQSTGADGIVRYAWAVRGAVAK